MPDSLSSLITDTLTFLKGSLPYKQVIFATPEECIFFQKKQNVEKPLLTKNIQSLPPIRPVLNAPPPIKKVPHPVTEVKVEDIHRPTQETHSTMKKTLQQIAPHLKLVDLIPDDRQAKRIATAWEEKIFDAEVILLACDHNDATLELLKGLAKAIDKNLAKSKVIAVERLEKEKKWDLFLEKNAFRLIIASEGIQKLSDLMRYYKALPANSQFFLNQTPLIILSAASTYQSQEPKALLWKTVCQILKK